MITVEKIVDFNNEITDNDVVVKFSAEWCGPCRVLGENIESIESDYPNINFIEVDVDEADEELVSKYKIRNIPVLFFIKNGEVLSKEIGVMSVDVLKEKINEYYG